MKGNRMKHILDSRFEYRGADETSTPGYLAKRFAEIRRKMKAKKEQHTEQHNVRPLKRAQGAAK